MKEIKFRAISKLKREPTFECTLEELLRGQVAVSYPEHWHWLRYTGHKDRSGKEIYEGDIMANELNPSGFVVESLFVAYEMWRSFEAMSKSEDWEVIGNIYENPELLQEVTSSN